MKKIVLSTYPFLFAIYPILALVVHNIIYIDPGSVVRSLVIAILFTGLIWVLLKPLFRDWDKAGIVTVWILILFFSYGHVYIQLQNFLGEAVRHRFLAGIYFVLLILGAWLVLVKLKRTATLQSSLVTVGFVLAAFSIIQLSVYELSSNRESLNADRVNIESSAGVNSDVNTENLPDIYWILLDGHTRSDILQEHYSYDNSAFVQELEDLGFYVAKCSQSNYPSTRYSVTSLMNANYLDQLPGVTRGIPPLKKSLVNQTVRSLGYTVIAFENRSNGHFDLGEDMRLSRNQLALGIVDFSGGLNEFEVVLMQTSVLRLVYDMPQLIPGLDPEILVEGEYYEHYQQTLFILNKLSDLPETQEPKFVFTHILVPHPPYVFSPEGKFLWAENHIVGYKSNTQFIDTQITEVAKEIIANSDRPVIIVIQGDHGPSGSQVTPHMRMSILNAYYVSDETKHDLYETITPVNTFRVIFNHYFGTNYPLLDDKSYLAFGEGQFTPENLVPNTCTP